MHYKYSNQGYFCSFFKKISACLVSPTGLEHEGLNIESCLMSFMLNSLSKYLKIAYECATFASLPDVKKKNHYKQIYMKENR